jgi:hypothetical protein
MGRNSYTKIHLVASVRLSACSSYPYPSIYTYFLIIGVYDPEDPYNDSARPNWWTPPLNTTWNFATHRIHGYGSLPLQYLMRSLTRIHSVNLAGLFVLDPFVTPALFQKYPSAVDEWTLSVAMAQDTQGDGLVQLEDHYKTFIVCLFACSPRFTTHCCLRPSFSDRSRYCTNRISWVNMG